MVPSLVETTKGLGTPNLYDDVEQYDRTQKSMD